MEKFKPPIIDADMDGVDDSESPVGFNLDTDVDDIDEMDYSKTIHSLMIL